MAFWKKLLECMKDMKYQRNGSDPCLYFKWTSTSLIIWLSWIDDCMVWVPREEVSKESENSTVGLTVMEKSMTFTQPVLLQSFEYEFELPERKTKTPDEAGSILIKTDPENKVTGKRHTYFRSGISKLLHMIRWSRPEIQNALRELTMQGGAPVEAHNKAIHRAMG
eukprot:9951251-Ditylum_brightwellii.AAC.1